MATYLVIDTSRNVVFNTIEWDGIAQYVPSGIDPSLALITQGEGAPGWLWDGEKAVDPNPPPADNATITTAPTGSVTSAQIA